MANEFPEFTKPQAPINTMAIRARPQYSVAISDTPPQQSVVRTPAPYSADAPARPAYPPWEKDKGPAVLLLGVGGLFLFLMMGKKGRRR